MKTLLFIAVMSVNAFANLDSVRFPSDERENFGVTCTVWVNDEEDAREELKSKNNSTLGKNNFQVEKSILHVGELGLEEVSFKIIQSKTNYIAQIRTPDDKFQLVMRKRFAHKNVGEFELPMLFNDGYNEYTISCINTLEDIEYDDEEEEWYTE